MSQAITVTTKATASLEKITAGVAKAVQELQGVAEVHVVDTKNNFDYVCRAILIRKPHTGNGSGEVDISFFPHKNAWEGNFCWSVQIKKPETSVALNSIITDAIARS